MHSQVTLHHLIRKIRPYFAQAVLQRGWDYYKNDAVDHISYSLAENVTATVYGSEPYEVELDLKHFTRSYCDCPYDGYCKHMAAVLFEVCNYMEADPHLFLSPNQVEIELDSQVVSIKKPTVKPGLSPAAIQASDKPSDWHRSFEKQTTVSYGMQSIHTLAKTISGKLLPLGAKWPETQKLFYELHVMLFTLKKVDELLTQMFRSYDYDRYYFGDLLNQTSSEALDKIHTITTRLAEIRSFETEPEKLQGTIDYLSVHAFPAEKSYVNWRDAYILFWSVMPLDSVWSLQERERVASSITAAGCTPGQMDAYLSAQIFFLIRQEEDHQAMKLAADKMSRVRFESFLIYLNSFAGWKQWERLAAWLEWLAPMVKSSQLQLEEYFHLWKQAVGHVPALAPNWKQAVLALLPYSYYAYSEYLLEQKMYKEWIDFNILCGVSPLELSKGEYKQVESADMRYLLPLYHHTVEQLIMEKKRDSYKVAVRHLKKMDVLYRKLKQADRWKQYITGLSKRYSRLRAFQEELQKGKWIG